MGDRAGVRVPAGGASLSEALASARAGETLLLEPGEHIAGLTIDRSVTLVGLDGSEATTLRGPGRSAVLAVEEDGLHLAIEGLTLTHGAASEAGGGLAVRGRGVVRVRGCAFVRNRGGLFGGGGLYARAGLLEVEDTLFLHNDARQGGAALVDGATHAEFKRCRFTGNNGERGADLRVTEGVVLAVKASSFAGGAGAALFVSGTASRAPEVTIDHCEIASGTLEVSSEHPGRITAKGCRLPASWRGTSGLVDGGANTYAKE